VVPNVRPVIEALTELSAEPAPIAWGGVNVGVDRVLSVPHSNHAFVACAFGFTVPLRVAVCSEIPVVATVVDVGGGGGLSPPPPPPQANREKAVIRNRAKKPVFLRICIASSSNIELENNTHQQDIRNRVSSL